MKRTILAALALFCAGPALAAGSTYLYDSTQPNTPSIGSGSGGVPLPVTMPAGAITTSGALQPPTAASGKITKNSVTLSANTSTTLAAANASRIAFDIQCAAGAVNIDETGGTLANATTGGTLVIPTGTFPLYIPPVATLTAITGYTATSQVCTVTEFNR